MKAVRIDAFKQAPQIVDVPAPVRTAGRSIVRMHAATVGHIDRTIWNGMFLRHPPLPYTPGVEAAGVVVESERFAPGQRVWLRGAGLGTLTDGTWCELIDAPDEALGALPDAVPMSLGSAFFSPCTSAWTALHGVAALQRGEHVMVSGATGAVGSITVQLAREMGARVTAITHDITEDLQADVLIDTVGGNVLAAALPHVVAGGRAVLVGYTAGNELTLDLAHFLQRDVSLLPLNMFRREAYGRAAVPALLERLADGRLSLGVREFALSDAAAALEWIAQRGHRGRAVLVPD